LDLAFTAYRVAAIGTAPSAAAEVDYASTMVELSVHRALLRVGRYTASAFGSFGIAFVREKYQQSGIGQTDTGTTRWPISMGVRLIVGELPLPYSESFTLYSDVKYRRLRFKPEGATSLSPDEDFSLGGLFIHIGLMRRFDSVTSRR